jgi:hypothetical protein
MSQMIEYRSDDRYGRLFAIVPDPKLLRNPQQPSMVSQQISHFFSSQRNRAHHPGDIQ